VVIAGQLGREMYINKQTKRQFRYFDLVEEGVSINDLRPLIDTLIQFEEVRVFYGKFESFITQQADSVTISGTTPLEMVKKAEQPKDEKFLFEPSLEEILAFFETQIFALLLRQIALESYLSQIGSRVIALESSTANIEDRLKELNWEKKRWQRELRNRKQLQNLVGISFWGG
jgi:F0F1-type ATP synthase gamma subunit